jgi:hypothetical protein
MSIKNTRQIQSVRTYAKSLGSRVLLGFDSWVSSAISLLTTRSVDEGNFDRSPGCNLSSTCTSRRHRIELTSMICMRMASK